MSKNKIEQNLRREIRKYAREQINLLPEIIKPRPKCIPRVLWRIGAKIFIDIEKLKEFLGKK
jgi:hypothetical protein